jgi:hypothetical protein
MNWNLVKNVNFHGLTNQMSGGGGNAHSSINILNMTRKLLDIFIAQLKKWIFSTKKNQIIKFKK